jgi:haloalkane dehalogenase
LVERLDLSNIILVVQDWGGLLGLTLPVDPGFRARLAGLLVMNTDIATGKAATPGFLAWRQYAASKPDMAVGGLMKRSMPMLSEAEIAAYDAPFPDIHFKAGVRAFPQLVMTEPDMPGTAESRAAAAFWAEAWDGPSFMAYGAADPVFPPSHMKALRARIRGCPPALVIPDGGHFVQEWGEPIARAALPVFGLSI